MVGDGPARAELEACHPAARFRAPGQPWSRPMPASTVFVFPSRTDTFGLVLLAALAGGRPIAAYPVQGPLDVVGGTPVAALDTDLRGACLAALEIARHPGAITPRAFAEEHSWRACTLQFLRNIIVEPDEA